MKVSLGTLVAAIAAFGTIPVCAQNLAPTPTACISNGAAVTVSAAGDRTVDTANIQNAIDTCTAVGGQLGQPVYVQLLPGNFVIEPITMKSWVYLLMPAGVVLNASTVTTDYQIAGAATCGSIASSSSGCKPLISAGIGSDEAASNTGIIGGPAAGIMGGTIEGHGWDITSNGSSWWAIADLAHAQGQMQVCPRLIEFDKGTNILLRDITIQNSPSFHVVFSQCSQITALHLMIQSPTPDHPGTARNTDGIDPISSTFVSITNNQIVSGDDNVAITAANKGPSHDINIQNNHFGAGHGLSIGSGTAAGVYNVFVKYIFFNGTDNGIRLKSDSSGGGEVQALYYETLCMSGINTVSKSSKNGAINLDTQYSSSTGSSYPYYHDIHFHDVYSDTASAIAGGTARDLARVNGAGGALPISNVSFYNVEFGLPTTATVATNIDAASIFLYSNSQNLAIPGVTPTPAPDVDPDFNEAANPNIVQFCQQYNN